MEWRGLDRLCQLHNLCGSYDQRSVRSGPSSELPASSSALAVSDEAPTRCGGESVCCRLMSTTAERGCKNSQGRRGGAYQIVQYCQCDRGPPCLACSVRWRRAPGAATFQLPGWRAWPRHNMPLHCHSICSCTKRVIRDSDPGAVPSTAKE